MKLISKTADPLQFFTITTVPIGILCDFSIQQIKNYFSDFRSCIWVGITNQLTNLVQDVRGTPLVLQVQGPAQIVRLEQQQIKRRLNVVSSFLLKFFISQLRTPNSLILGTDPISTHYSVNQFHYSLFTDRIDLIHYSLLSDAWTGFQFRNQNFHSLPVFSCDLFFVIKKIFEP